MRKHIRGGGGNPAAPVYKIALLKDFKGNFNNKSFDLKKGQIIEVPFNHYGYLKQYAEIIDV